MNDRKLPTNPSESAESLEISPPERTIPALLMSLALHVLLLTTIGLLWTRAPSGTGEAADRPVGIALVHRLPDRDRYVDAAELPVVENQATAEQASAAASALSAPPDLSPPIDLAGVLQAMQSTPSPVAGTGLAGDMQLDGDDFGSGRGRGSVGDASSTTTTLFGISGSGSRFVYVFDRSDSMNGFGGRPLRAAKSEMIRSLRTMTDQQRFQIIFYNDKPTPFRVSGMPLQMVAGEDSYKSLAENYIGSIAAFGGTEHDAALRLALRMAPDVIFFLTDARIPRLSASQLREIKSRADSNGTTIHAIEFGADPVAPLDSFLRDLAAMNGGQYRYVDVRQLGAGRPPQPAPQPTNEAASPSP